MQQLCDALRDLAGRKADAPRRAVGLSLNFELPVARWQQRDGQVIDPYRLLLPMFDGLPADGATAAETGLSDELREGRAAMAAYAQLQFEDLPVDRRKAMKRALLQYCELDMLAMVMAMQAWMDMGLA